jgi:hypothetical protein
MSVSLRRFRALVFEYHDAGTAGEVDSTYLIKTSGDADDMWWCSRMPASGREVTVGMQPDHHVDAVFGFAAHVPIDKDDVIRCDGQSFSVRAVLDRDYGRDEVQVYAERKVELVLDTT